MEGHVSIRATVGRSVGLSAFVGPTVAASARRSGGPSAGRSARWERRRSAGNLGEAKLKLTPIPKQTLLLVVHYGSFDDALRDASRLVESDPAAIETLDEKILTLAKKDVGRSNPHPKICTTRMGIPPRDFLSPGRFV